MKGRNLILLTTLMLSTMLHSHSDSVQNSVSDKNTDNNTEEETEFLQNNSESFDSDITNSLYLDFVK